ncbi:MAG: sugar phosphate isomerase/epimerase [Candidatus Gastranaerophilales bacterium]|nr:sugar phosphate isomerase/epimerase [Candidatus Gastranaerophilales bacterium]
MSYDIYISSKIKNDFNEVVSLAQKMNLNIEIKTFVKNRVLDNLDNILPVYKDALKNFNGKLSMHGAFAGLCPVSDKVNRRKKTVFRFDQTVDIAKTLNVKIIVFHSGIDTFDSKYFDDTDFLGWFIDSETEFWSEYIKKLENLEMMAVIENTSENSPEILRKIVERVNSDNLKLCIDTGHVNHKTNLTVQEWIEKTGKNLYYMHLHNNYKLFDDHNSLLKGTIDFNEVFKTLKETGIYPGLSLEIADYKAAMESLKFVREKLQK